MKTSIFLFIVALLLELYCINNLVIRNKELQKELLQTEVLLLKEKLNCKAPEVK